MKAVFVGGGVLTVNAARLLIKAGHEVVIVELDKGRIQALSDELPCGYVQGDGSKPAILRETDPVHTDFLFCLTGNDQTNIIAGMVGRSLGFARIVTKIQDPEFEHICLELGLEDTIMPALTIGRYLADMLEGQDLLELSAMIKDEARVFSFVARESDAGSISALGLPADSRVICLYRREKFTLANEDTALKIGDEVVVLTHRRNLADLQARWANAPGSSGEAGVHS
jgi:trk system potassium uptake protein TrkA